MQRSIPDTHSHTEGGPPDSGFLPCGCHTEPRYRWYVVRTEAGQERLAACSMAEAGLMAWLPLYADKDRIRPLFPRYAFAQFDRSADLWRRIYRARGVETILGMMPGTPDPVPNAALVHLWRQCSADGVIYPVGADTGKITPNAHVRVTSGPLAGLEGIARRSSWDRVSVLMSLLQGERLVSLPVGSVAILR